MSLIEQATKRLEELTRAGVAVPWEAAGHGQSNARKQVEPDLSNAEAHPLPTAAPPGPDPEVELADSPASPTLQHAGEHRSRGTVTLDLAQIEASGLLVPSQARTALAEEFRQIKRPLLKNARSLESGERRYSLIMVTSALPGEGKTTCAVNLAMSVAAEMDVSVILVDADVLRPDLPDRLGIKAERGLMDILENPGLDVSEVLLETNVPKLSILMAGTLTNLATERLASEAMGTLLTTLTTRYPDHVVIFDAPPLLVTNEAQVLASHVGQVVVVVDASNTPADAVTRAFALVAQCPVVMSVLNKAPEGTGSFGYGYYYA